MTSSKCLGSVIIMMLLAGFSSAAFSQGVCDIPDPNLEARIREAIEKPIGDIHDTDCEELHDLFAAFAGIADLTGLECCGANLTELSLGFNEITDLEPLRTLTELTSLDLNMNDIHDLTPLEGLTRLEELSLDFNGVHDLSPLEGLVNLSSLQLHWNQVSDLTPLEDLVNLTRLSLGMNSVSDLAPLARLELLELLDLNFSRVTDLSPLERLTELTELRFSNWPFSSGIAEIKALENLEKLSVLQLTGHRISDLSPLEHLSNLTELDLGDNRISDLEPLAKASFPVLTDLFLDENQISDISALVSNPDICVSNPGCNREDVGLYINLMDNPLSCAPSTQSQVSALEDRGVFVHWADADCGPYPSGDYIVPIDSSANPILDRSGTLTMNVLGIELQLDLALDARGRLDGSGYADIDGDGDFETPVIVKGKVKSKGARVTVKTKLKMRTSDVNLSLSITEVLDPVAQTHLTESKGSGKVFGAAFKKSDRRSQPLAPEALDCDLKLSFSIIDGELVAMAKFSSGSGRLVVLFGEVRYSEKNGTSQFALKGTGNETAASVKAKNVTVAGGRITGGTLSYKLLGQTGSVSFP